MTVGEGIRAARKRAGLTQAALAEKMGVPYQSIGQWETGKRNPKYETLERIASALGIHVFDLSGIGEKLDRFRPVCNRVKLPSGEDVPFADAPDEVKRILSLSAREVYDELADDDKQEFWRIMSTGLREIAEFRNSLRTRLNVAFDSLTDDEKLKIVESIEELAEISRHQQDPDEIPIELELIAKTAPGATNTEDG